MRSREPVAIATMTPYSPRHIATTATILSNAVKQIYIWETVMDDTFNMPASDNESVSPRPLTPKRHDLLGPRKTDLQKYRPELNFNGVWVTKDKLIEIIFETLALQSD